MNINFKDLTFYNPLANAHQHFKNDFCQLATSARIRIVCATIFGALLGLPLLGIGCIATGTMTFRAMVSHEFSKKNTLNKIHNPALSPSPNFKNPLHNINPSETNILKPESKIAVDTQSIISPNFQEIIDQGNLNPSLSLEDLIGVLKDNRIHFDYFKDHNVAKIAFQQAMMRVLNSEVNYVKAKPLDNSFQQNRSPDLPLPSSIFHWKNTTGVEFDIKEATKDANAVHLFSVASQYNCAEASRAETPPIGEAMTKSAQERTQGPLAQRTNPRAFELVLAFLTHLDFNMMENALLPHIGTVPATSTVLKSTDGHTTMINGYLQAAGWFSSTPESVKTHAQTDLLAVNNYLEEHMSSFETVCYSSRPGDGKGNPIYLILAAAPTMNAAMYPEEARNRLEYLTAVANFTTQFQQVVELAKKNPNKKIVLHATLPGLGAFGNKPENLANAFRDAALNFYEDPKLTDILKRNIAIEIDVFQNDSRALEVVNALGLDSQLHI